MTTFQEIHDQMVASINKKEILNHIVLHLEQTFVGGPGGKKVLQKDDKTLVPDAAFESVIKELLEEIAGIEKELKKIASTPMTDLPEAVAEEPKKSKPKN